MIPAHCMRRKPLLLAIVVPSLLASAFSHGQDSELAQLRQEILRLKKVNQQQAQLIQLLERKFVEIQQQPSAASPTTSPQSASVDSDHNTADDLRPRKSRSVENFLQEEHTFFEQQYSIELGLNYSRYARNEIGINGFYALDAIFLGQLTVDEIESDNLTTQITGRVGLTDRLQMDLVIPYVYRQSNFQSTGTGGAGDSLSQVTVDNDFLGDISVGGSYRLLPETATRPDLVLNLRLRTPTGKDPYGIDILQSELNDNLTYPRDVPTGSGVWGLTAGLSFVNTSDPAILFGNLDYNYNFEQSFDDIGSDPDSDTPGDIKLGDSIGYGLGVAFAINERLSMSFSYSQRFVQESQSRVAGGTWSTAIGSDANIASMNTGVTYALTQNTTLVTSLGIGLTPDASDYTVSFKLPYSL